MALKARKPVSKNADKVAVSTNLDTEFHAKLTDWKKEQEQKNNCTIPMSDLLRYALEELMENTELEITVE